MLAAAVVDRVPGAPDVRDAVLAELGVPATVLPHLHCPATFDSARTRTALFGSGIEIPEFADYADVLWRYWTEPPRPGPRPATGRPAWPAGGS